jgi:uncharacterized FlaG/YvyC family protein
MDVFAINADNSRMESPPQEGTRHAVQKNQDPNTVQAKEETQAAAEEAKQIDLAKLEEAAKELASRFDVKVEMAQDESTGRYVVRILSQDGERVIRQMPPESTLRMAAQARQGQIRGIMESVV